MAAPYFAGYVLDENMPAAISLIFTGPAVNPRYVRKGDIPQYPSRRGSVLWDNWMASDTNNPVKLRLMPPQDRNPDVFDALEGYLLNTCFGKFLLNEYQESCKIFH